MQPHVLLALFWGRLAKGSKRIVDQTASTAQGVCLLFAKGTRPDRSSLLAFLDAQSSASLSFDPADRSPVHLVASGGEMLETGSRIGGSGTEGGVWLEVLREGLTFDVLGLAPGGPVAFPIIEYRFDLAEMPGAAAYEAMQIVPGTHLLGGERSMPVVKAMMALARDMVQHFDEAKAVVWPPSQSAIGRRFFESVSTAWLDDGPFPALGLTAFRETVDGALQSVGLDYWIEQELRIESPLSIDKVAATRLGVRIINQLILVGGIEQNERIVAPDGSRLLLTLSRNRKFVRVARE